MASAAPTCWMRADDRALSRWSTCQAPRPLPRPVADRALVFGLAVLAIAVVLSAVLFAIGPVWP